MIWACLRGTVHRLPVVASTLNYEGPPVVNEMLVREECRCPLPWEQRKP
jgi:hypothetical protein